MSLIKRADVKNHLSRKSTSVYPFGLSRKGSAPAADATAPSAKPEAVDISISPMHPLDPEAVPDAQVGGSIGVPETRDNS